MGGDVKMIYVFITKKGKVMAKSFSSQKKAYDYRWTIKAPIEVWGKASKVTDWLYRYKKQLLTKALIKMNSRYI